MSFFKKSKPKKKKMGADVPAKPSKSKAAEQQVESNPQKETSPQRVGIVSGILTTSASVGTDEPTAFGSVVDRHFGPDQERKSKNSSTLGSHDVPKNENLPEQASEGRQALPRQHQHLRAVDSPLPDNLASPQLEVDPMAHVGHATTITGNIVAEEDLEVQGTVEGSIRLADHTLTIGTDGLIKATVEAHTVLVMGRISGDVVASELVEIKAGGIIGGDVKAPRVIMHDGGIVVGGLDMSASLPKCADSSPAEPPTPERPKLKRVELPRDSASDEGSA